MSDRRNNDRGRRSSSAKTGRDEDDDFRIALKLSAELNGDLGGHLEAAAAASRGQADYDGNVALAVQMQSNNGGTIKTTERIPPYLPEMAASSSTALSQGTTITNPSVTGDCTEKAFKTLSEFLHHLKASQCPKCGTHLIKCESDVVKYFDECGGRVFLIWLLLCGLDAAYCAAKTEEMNMIEAVKTKPAPAPKMKDKGKGKAKVDQLAQQNGIGYGGNDDYSGYMSSSGLVDFGKDFSMFDDNIFSTSKGKHYKPTGPGRTLSDNKSQIFEAQQTSDKLGRTVLGLLQQLLPSLDRGYSFDMNPPEILADMLVESKILDYCLELLYNNSLEDAFVRKPTYDALLNFIQVISMHYITANLTVFSKERPLRPETCNLLTKSFGGSPATSTRMAPSIVDSMRNLSSWSNMVLKNAEHQGAIYNAGSDQELLSLCRKISGLWQRLAACISSSESDLPITAALDTSTEGVAAVVDITDNQICATPAFATKAKQQSRSAPGRFNRLISEINILKTSLPPGIFVRHGESRLDILKCAIIGPEGTPYENGIFEFDLYCPAEFPDVPPLVSFKGTDGGVAGINSNLYPDGKVCLSLLGTWEGEPWKPRESTLLQVLVSLQAMVFCEQPWYNEPGRELRGHKNYASKDYNRRICELTVRIAMLGWLKESPQIWQDVVEHHFKCNADKILQTVIKWSKMAMPSIPSAPANAALPVFPGLWGCSESGLLLELHQHLLQYGATVEIPDIPKQDDEPQPKKPRVEGPQPEGFQAHLQAIDNEVPPDFDNNSDEYEFSEDYGLNEYANTFDSGHLFGSGYGDSSTHHPGYSFRGHGHVLGNEPGDPPSAEASQGISRSDHGRDHGAASADRMSLRDSIRESKYGSGRMLGNSDDRTDRGGHGGRGGRGGSGSSKA